MPNSIMPNSIERLIINGSMLFFFSMVVFGLFTSPQFTGMVTSDGDYKSPTSDNDYKSPTSDKSYVPPTTGPGYIAPKIDESWEAPKEGPEFKAPEVGPGFEVPELGEGFVRIGTYNVSFNESSDKIIEIVLKQPHVNFSDEKNNISNKTKDEIIKNDPKKPKTEAKGPIDKASVGGWKVYQESHYYKRGGSKFASPLVTQMNLHDDGTWDYKGYEGTWEVAEITESDWEKWGISNANFNKKLIFHGWPEGVDGIADGPIEDTSYGARYLWAVYNAEPPEVQESAQVWKRFVAAPYSPKVEDEAFSELSLIGRWGFHFKGLSYEGEIAEGTGKWETDFGLTTIMEIKADKTWTFGSSKGTWKVLPIEDEDWKTWETEPYGPKKKIVLDNFGDGEGSGPIETYKGEVSFFWVIYKLTDPETNKQSSVQKKFRPYESSITYLTAEVKGHGKISSDDRKDGKLDCSGEKSSLGEKNAAGCTAEYDVGKEVELKATPEKGWLFLQWSGGCEGAEIVCRVTMEKSKTVTAIFVPGCNDDSECSSDQQCENSRCAPVACDCGYVQNHECQKYECCKKTEKTDCGEEKTCDAATNKCISESTCREFSIKGDPAEKHDVVFVGDGFDDYKLFKQLLVFLVDYEEKYNGMFSVSPFKENKDKFNFWMVLAPDYQHLDDGEPVNEDIERFVKTCERDTVVVISRNTYRPYAFFPTSGSKGGTAYVSLGFVAIRGTDYAAEHSGGLLLHEFGHAFGGLTDEYIEYGKGTRNDLASVPNCAETLDEAKVKWGDLVGVGEVDFYTGIPNVTGTTYFKNSYVSVPEIGLFPDGSDMGDGGCSYDLKNIRPTKSSLMKNQFEPGYDFGPVNERALQRKIDEYSPEQVTQNTDGVAAQGGRGMRYVEDAG